MIRLMAQCLFGMSVGLCLVSAAAQDAPTPITEKAEKKGEPVIQQTPLNAIVLLDPEGHRVLLPGPWSLSVADDFLDYLLNVQQNPVPPFILRNVSATGTIVGNYVETDVRIELWTTSYRPVRVPLGFKEGILPSEEQTDKPTFRYNGTGSASLTVDPQERQYVAIVSPQTPAAESEHSEKSERPDINQRHIISLVLWLPFGQNGGGKNRLPLSFPQSNSSQFQLEVPAANVDISVTRGFLLDKQENADRQSTLLKVQGLRTDTEISWGKKSVEIVDNRPVLLVDRASIDVRLDVRSAVYDAVLPVSSATSTFDHLQIRLPQGCVLDREISDRYAVAGDYSIGEVNDESVVTIRLPQKTAGPVSLRLRGTQQFEGDGETPDFKCELEGFEVLGAERQTGFLSVSVIPSEMKPHWDPVRGVRHTEGTTAAPLTPSTPVVYSPNSTRFEFISQPFLLRVQVVSPKTRINVKPEYQFHIQRGLITMTARLAYTVSGSKTAVLRLRLSDSEWRYDFSMSRLVDASSVELDESGLLTMPLRNPMDGTFNIEFQAYRTIASEEEQWHRIILPIPKPPQEMWSEPAPVVILSDNNVEVFPIDESYSVTAQQRILGLTRQTRRTMPIRSNPPDLQQEPLLYRADPADAVFVADLIYRQRQIKASMQTEVRFLEESNRITQTILYEAAYVPVDRLYFLLPQALATSGNIQVQWSSQTLELRDTISGAGSDVPDNWVRKSIQLPESMFKFQLTFQYPQPPLTVFAESVTQLPLSFICPAEVPVSYHNIRFHMPPGYKMELHNESRLLWESFREPRRLTSEVVETFRSVQSPTRIVLLVSAAEQNVSGTTIVERAWLQTWLTSGIRVDRATYLVKSMDDSITIQLPPDAVREHRIIVRVDRREIQPNLSPWGTLTIPILPEQHNRLVEIALDYRYAFVMSQFVVPVILPSFTKDVLIQSQYWQVIIPQGKHIIGCPAGWTPEYHWIWNGLFWGRSPSIQMSDLGFDTNEPAVSKASQYVFHHLQPPSYVELYVVNRSLIVLCSSGIALLVGLLLIYLPQARYAGSLFGLGIALVAVLFYQPPLVLLMLQAAVFGVFLALGTGYVYRIFHREKEWIPSAFPAYEDGSLSYTNSPPSLQTVHEVIMDEESAGKDVVEPPVVNNGQS